MAALAAAAGMGAVLKRRLAGVVFLGVLAGLVALTIALYQKAFTPVVEVTLQADKAGNQLATPSDVKLRGLIVGEVREVSSTGQGATLRLALDPAHVDQIPRNVRARLLPKTLFGEKYVDLVVPQDPSGQQLSSGDVIPQDHVSVGRETEETLNDLLPLLRELRPQQLSVTLNALSGALRGRGDELGENLELVDAYLREFNPELPTLEGNLRGLADFADNLEQTTPDLVRLLDNLTEINRDLVEQEQELNTFLTSTVGFSEEMGGFLRENEQRLVRLAMDSLPSLQLYAKYSPEFPCLAQGLALSDDFIGDVFGGLQPGLHITLEFTEDQGGYQPRRDEPAYKDRRGPRCYGLPDPPTPAEDINFQDGYRDDLGPDTTQDPPAEGARAEAAYDPATALAGPQGQRAVMGAVLGPVLGVPPEQVPDLAYLLFGPVARGTEVSLS
jgi:phospholipid/cholesterol/gamma-HCH transport system substrate-binding protein